MLTCFLIILRSDQDHDRAATTWREGGLRLQLTTDRETVPSDLRKLKDRTAAAKSPLLLGSEAEASQCTNPGKHAS